MEAPRKPVNRSNPKLLQVRTNAEIDGKLADLAADLGLSKSAVVVMLISREHAKLKRRQRGE
jgi:post-segregation antitoxin (ccd killing protein)